MANKYLDGSLTASAVAVGGSNDGRDKAHRAARDYLDANPNARPSFNASLANKVGQGVTFGWADEAAAGVTALRDKARDPFGRPLSEYYDLEKAMQDELLRDATAKTGAVGTGAEVVGGLASGLGLAKGGATLLREGQGLAARIGAGLVEGAGYGAVQGSGSTEGDKAKGAIGGAVGGAAVGAGLPLLAAGARTVASPVLSNLAAARDPGGYADRKIFETMQRAGMSEADILAETQAAGSQPYALADALDYEGRRLLSTVTKAPGEGRRQALEFLQSRQADQPDRVVNQLRRGFGAPSTADRLERDIRAQRTLEAGVNYGAARNSAGFVDPTDAIRLADDTLGPGVNRLPGVGSQLADDTVESVVRRARSMLTNDREILTDFPSAFRVKRDLDAMIDSANPTQQRELIPIRNALDEALATASQPYAAARDRFRQQSGQIDAIDLGRQAAGSTLAQDAIPAFRQMPADQKAPFRTGFVDPLVSKIVNTTAPGANRAKFSPNATAKMDRFALPSRRSDMMSALDRERRMHSTLTEAAGGSKTVENAADAADMGIDPAVFSNLMAGRFRDAGMSAARGAFNQLTGNTERVRSELANRLLPLQGSEPLTVLLPRVSRTMREQQARNNTRELRAIRGLLNLGSLAAGRMQ
jgi:hypothetical protein